MTKETNIARADVRNGKVSFSLTADEMSTASRWAAARGMSVGQYAKMRSLQHRIEERPASVALASILQLLARLGDRGDAATLAELRGHVLRLTRAVLEETR